MAAAPTNAASSRATSGKSGATGLAGRLRLPLHQARLAWHQPERWKRLHYSTLLAGLHSIGEPSELAILQNHFDVDAASLRDFESDLLGAHDFRREIEDRHRRVRGETIRLFGPCAAEDHDRSHRLLYYLTRLLRPRTVVETGVFDGFSSALILQALHDNRRGELCSIDLPARTAIAASTDRMLHDTLPAGRDPGWIIPQPLRARWTLREGASADLLAPWLAELGSIDLFFHDSLHTLENMTWEYETAWGALGRGGLLVSDDVFWSRAFWRFTRPRGLHASVSKGVGIVRKTQLPPGTAA